MFRKISNITLAVTIILLVGCGQVSIYDKTLPVDLTAEQIGTLEAEIQKWDTFIIQSPELKKLVVEKMGTDAEAELPEEAGFFTVDDPNDLRPPPDFFIEKAIALDKLGRTGEAIRTYDELLQIYENSSVAWNNLGRLYEKLGMYDEAVANYKKLIDVFSLSQYRLDIAQAWYEAGELEKARTSYELWQKETGGENKPFAAKIGL